MDESGKDIVFISGRPREQAEKKLDFKTHKNALKNDVYYLDDKGFTATYREGKWFFQKFHTKEQVKQLATDNGFEMVSTIKDMIDHSRKTTV